MNFVLIKENYQTNKGKLSNLPKNVLNDLQSKINTITSNERQLFTNLANDLMGGIFIHSTFPYRLFGPSSTYDFQGGLFREFNVYKELGSTAGIDKKYKRFLPRVATTRLQKLMDSIGIFNAAGLRSLSTLVTDHSNGAKYAVATLTNNFRLLLLEYAKQLIDLCDRTFSGVNSNDALKKLS